MKIETKNKEFSVDYFKLSQMKTNCYVISNKKEKKAVVIDPGEHSYDLLNFLKQNNLEVEFVLLTHGHFDHILGTNSLNPKKTYIGAPDEEILYDGYKNAGFFMGINNFEKIKNLEILKDEEEIQFLTEKFKTIKTPGHTKGSVCFIFDNVIFTGDTLFKESVGRCDLYGGDSKKIKDSIKKFKEFEKEYLILPGHGQFSTLSFEKENNPYFN